MAGIRGALCRVVRIVMDIGREDGADTVYKYHVMVLALQCWRIRLAIMYSCDIEFEKVQLSREIAFIELSKWPVSDQLFHFLRPLLQCPSLYSKAEMYQGLLPQLSGKQAIGEIYLTTVAKFSDKGIMDGP
jgi:hypothetical protein